MKRRTFLATSAAAITAFPYVATKARAQDRPIVLGHGDFHYRVVPGWGVLGDDTPVNNCHGIVEDREGHIVLLTDHVQNNVIIYDRAGRLVNKWTLELPGAHGLSIVTEAGREVLYITDIRINKFLKATLDGEVIAEWGWPEGSGKYDRQGQYRPSWTLHKPNGDFFVLDGYGRDYIQHFNAAGEQINHFGGQEGGITHWGPHGGIYDDNGLLIAMSDQRYLMKLNDVGEEQFRVPLPGGNPRQVQRVGDHYFVGHLADNWPADRNSPGFVSVLDAQFNVVANIDGSPPQYDEDGNLQPMSAAGNLFTHPHDLCVAGDGSLYVAQFLSNNTYPIKLERVGSAE